MLNVIAGSIWFLLTPLIGRPRELAKVERVDRFLSDGKLEYAAVGAGEMEAERVDRFFADMHTPVDFEREEGAGTDNLQLIVMGKLCLIYGGFITLLALIPNPLFGRCAFLFCGGIMFGIGWVLHRSARTGARAVTSAQDPEEPESHVVSSAPATPRDSP